MKKYAWLLLVMMITSTAIFAQDGQRQRQTPEERTTTVMEKMAPLKMDAAATEKTKAVMLEFYTAQQKAMEEMRASGTMDRDAMMAKRDELVKARNEKLKTIFTADQMKQWTDEIEPSLRPQRRN